MGRDILGRELRKQDYSLATAEREGWLEAAATRLRLGTAEDLLVAVGYGKVSPAHAADAVLIDVSQRGRAPRRRAPPPSPGRRPPAHAPKRSIAGIKVQGEADILVKFAKCCSPVPGDAIVGFISRGHGVVIHTRECPKALDLDPARRVDVAWDDEAKTLRPVAVQVTCSDRPGLLAAISKSFTEHGVNISQAKCRTTEDGRAVNTFQVTVGHLDQLKTVLRSLGTSIQGWSRPPGCDRSPRHGLEHPQDLEAPRAQARRTWARSARPTRASARRRRSAELFAGARRRPARTSRSAGAERLRTEPSRRRCARAVRRLRRLRPRRVAQGTEGIDLSRGIVR